VTSSLVAIGWTDETKPNLNPGYGFIKGRSTALQLLRIMDEWTTQLDSGSQDS